MRKPCSYKNILMLLLGFFVLSIALCVATDEAEIKKSDYVSTFPSSLSDRLALKKK
jgi:hypothetical protein